MECFEKRIITNLDTGGLQMNWGNHQAIVELTELIAKRKDFGAILADGVKVAAEKIGKGSYKYAMHIGGQEIPYHDPRLQYHLATTYRMDATPARHMQGEGNHPPGISQPIDPKTFSGRGVYHLRGQAMTHVMNSVGMCSLVHILFQDISDFIGTVNATTGWDTNLEELVKTGDRITTLRHAFNLREGINPLQYHFPERLLGRPKLTTGPTAGVEVDEVTLLKDYLIAEDWDLKTAIPSKSKLISLGLDDVAKELKIA
jgi:aldehyde:ferredoxin oxidoreductase